MIFRVTGHFLNVQLVERIQNVEAPSREEALRLAHRVKGAVVSERVLREGGAHGELSGYLCNELGFMPPPPQATEIRS